MKFTEKEKAENDARMMEWLIKTAKNIDDILNDEIEEIFAVSGVYYKDVDEIYNTLLELQNIIQKIYEKKIRENSSHQKNQKAK